MKEMTNIHKNTIDNQIKLLKQELELKIENLL